MKIRMLLSFVATVAILAIPAYCQEPMKPDSLGLPGDNLNLYAVLRIFQESPTLEEFERRLNSKDQRVNNLDLNGDGDVDYIRVKDNVVQAEHTIILQVQLSKTDSQDVAVILVNKDQDNKVFVQMIGDEALYGRDYIVEPNYDRSTGQAEGETPNPAYSGLGNEETPMFEGSPVEVVRVTPAEVYRWPIVQHIYVGGYRPWWSPWYFGFFPSWWRPWRPFYWHAYWGYHYYHYRYYFGHYRHWPTYRYPQVHARYFGTQRSSSNIVADRRRNGLFKETYTRPDLRKKGVEGYRSERRREMRETRAGVRAQKESVRKTNRQGKATFDGTAPGKSGGSGRIPKNRDAASPGQRPQGGGREANKPAVRSPRGQSKGERSKEK
jgi:hypothetical protein